MQTPEAYLASLPADYPGREAIEARYAPVLIQRAEAQRARDEYEEKVQFGGRGVNNLYTDQINKVMRDHGYTRLGYLGAVPRDEISYLDVPSHGCAGCILNLDTSNEPGSHWTAAFFDDRGGGDRTVEYFDSLGKPAPEDIKMDLKRKCDEVDPTANWQFKQNLIRHQFDKTTTCGGHAMKFLVDRFGGTSFAKATGFDQAKEFEASLKHVKQFRNLFRRRKK